jgi:hypothetical protein
MGSTGGASFSATGEAGASGLPPTGFYMATLTTKSDDCARSLTTAPRPNVVVSTKENGFGVGLGADGLFSDVPWQGFSTQLPGCDMTWNVDVTAFDSRSIDLDITEIWNSTAQCDLPAQDVPAAACTSEWLQHFELETPCPASIERPNLILSCR